MGQGMFAASSRTSLPLAFGRIVSRYEAHQNCQRLGMQRTARVTDDDGIVDTDIDMPVQKCRMS